MFNNMFKILNVNSSNQEIVSGCYIILNYKLFHRLHLSTRQPIQMSHFILYTLYIEYITYYTIYIGSVIDSETQSILIVSRFSTKDEGNYTVACSNPSGATATATIQLITLAPTGMSYWCYIILVFIGYHNYDLVLKIFINSERLLILK